MYVLIRLFNYGGNMLSPEELVSIKNEDKVSVLYDRTKPMPSGIEAQLVGEALKAEFDGVVTGLRLHVLHWLDTYGPMPTRQLAELTHGKYGATEVGRHLHSLRTRCWAQPHSYGPNGRITEWRFDTVGRYELLSE